MRWMSMATDFARHEDAEEAAEAYVMNRMNVADAAAFEGHVAECPNCFQLVGETTTFIEILRDAIRPPNNKLRALARTPV
jgi:hypothetical protein